MPAERYSSDEEETVTRVMEVNCLLFTKSVDGGVHPCLSWSGLPLL